MKKMLRTLLCFIGIHKMKFVGDGHVICDNESCYWTSKERVFIKKIYQVSKKTRPQMYKLLEAEVIRLGNLHPLYELKKFSNPVYFREDCILYHITYKRKKHAPTC